MKTAIFIVTLLLAYAFGMMAEKAARAEVAPISAVRLSGASVAASVHSAIIHARTDRFRAITRHCQSNPGRCVRVGNTYIVQ